MYNYEKKEKAYSLWGEKKTILFEKQEEEFSEKDIGALGRSLTSLNSANRKLANRIINTSQRSYEPAPVCASYEPPSLPITLMSPSWTHHILTFASTADT